MRILIGTVGSGLRGGVPATEQPFHSFLAGIKDVKVEFFPFGRKKENEGLLMKIFGRFIDLFIFANNLLKFKPDLIHLNSAFDKRALLRDLGYVFLANLFQVPIFIKYHGSTKDLLESKNIFWKGIIFYLKKSTTGIGALSTEERNNFISAGYRDKQAFVVKNCVDVNRFKHLERYQGDPPQVLFISRFVSTKGLSDVIRSVRILKDKSRMVKLICVGDGEEKEPAIALTKDLGIEDRVEFVGYVPEETVADYYQKGSFLVFPTFHGEGFSMVIFQGLAAGLPIITTKIRAAADYLFEDDNCLWVEAKNPQMLASQMIYLLDHPELQKSMSENNKKTAWRFTADIVGKEYLDIYNKLHHQ